MHILRLLSAGIIATSLGGAAQADAINVSFNSDNYADYLGQDPFTSKDDTFTANFQTTATGNTYYILTYGFSGGTQADGTSVTGGGFDSTLSIFDSLGNLKASNDNEFNGSEGCFAAAEAFAPGIIDHGATDTSGTTEASPDACLQLTATNISETFTLKLGTSDGVPWSIDNNFWAFDILGVQFASAGPISDVPAPGLLGLFGVVFAGLSVRRAKRLVAR